MEPPKDIKHLNQYPDALAPPEFIENELEDYKRKIC